MKNKITIREQSAVRLHIYMDGEVSPTVLYRVAHPGSIETVEAISDLPAVSSRWWRSRKIQDFYTAEKALYDARRDAERKRVEAETINRIQAEKAGHLDQSGLIDFSIPENQRAKLNEIINTATDPGEALDALKVIISKQAEIVPERKDKPVRFYLPLDCKEGCPLYQMADDALRLRSGIHYKQYSPAMQAQVDEKLQAGGRAIIEKFVNKLIHR